MLHQSKYYIAKLGTIWYKENVRFNFHKEITVIRNIIIQNKKL